MWVISARSANQPKDQKGARSSVKEDGGEGEEDHFWHSKLLRWLHSNLFQFAHSNEHSLMKFSSKIAVWSDE